MDAFFGLGTYRMALRKNFESSMFFFSFKILKKRAEIEVNVISSAEIRSFHDV